MTSPTETPEPAPVEVAVLVVDDDQRNLKAAAAALDGIADLIVTASSGQEALRHLLVRDFAVVVLDISMPELDGYETARLIRARARNKSVPIIFATAYDRDQRDVLRGYDLGAVDFLFKPIQPEMLRAKVGTFAELQRSRVRAERQAERVRALERREHQRELAAQRRALEAAAVNRQMREQQRIAEQLAEIDRRKDEFLAMLGHELRTPVAAMTVGVELATAPNIAPDVRERAHRVIANQLRHLVRLIDDLLDVTRIGSGRITLQPCPAAVPDLIERAVELARPALEAADHALIVDDQVEDRGHLLVDPVRIVQALANLLHNAARYTDPGGRITVRARRSGDRIELEVEDNGRGIEPDKLESIFDIFVRDARDRDGLGLGLPLARTLVDLHGGVLRAASDGPGTGARFTIELPLQPGRAEPDEVDDVVRPQPRPAPRAIRVLVVEDDNELRMTLRDLLESWGHEVVVASCGLDGLRALADQAPDLALVDIGLPDIDGCQLAREARAQRYPTQLYALTGFTQAADRRRIREAGFVDMLPKPPDLDLLRRRLDDRAHELDEPGA